MYYWNKESGIPTDCLFKYNLPKKFSKIYFEVGIQK